MRNVVRIDTFSCAVRRQLGITCQFEESTVVCAWATASLNYSTWKHDEITWPSDNSHYYIALQLRRYSFQLTVKCMLVVKVSPPPIVACFFLSRQDRRHIQGILVCYYFISHLTMRSAYAVHIQPIVLVYVFCNQMQIHMWATANKRSWL